jgi:hypothetical protein
MKKIIEAIKAFFFPKAPIVEVKKEVPYKIEPIVVEETSVKKKAKKKSVKKKTNELK